MSSSPHLVTIIFYLFVLNQTEHQLNVAHRQEVLAVKSDGLKRQIGLTGVIVISLSAMLGSGIFVLPALAAESMHANAAGFWLAYVLAATVVLPGALSKSELGTAMPSSGGSYTYLERTFGPGIGTISGLGLWASFMLKSSFALIGFAAYIEVFSPGMSDVSLKLFSTALIVLLVVINIVGVAKVKNLQIPIVSISVGAMVIICVWGLLFSAPDLGRPASAAATSFSTPVTLASTTALVFVSYAGVTKIAAIAGEVKNPSRNLPYGMLLSLLIATILYALVSYTIAAVLEDGWWMGTDGYVIGNPVAALAETIGGRPLALIISVLAVLTMISMALAGILASSRFGFAMARDNLLPSALENVHDQYNSPHVSIMITGLMMTLAIWLLDVHAVAKLASGFKIMIFILINISVLVLRQARKTHAWYRPEFYSPLYPFFQIYGIIGGLVLLIFLGPKALIGALSAVVLGVVVYQGYGRKNAKVVISPWKTLQTMLTDPERAKQEVRMAAFVEADSGLKGKISLSEFINAMEILGYVNQRRKLRELFHSADPEYRGYLRLDEFMSQVDLVQESE